MHAARRVPSIAFRRLAAAFTASVLSRSSPSDMSTTTAEAPSSPCDASRMKPSTIVAAASRPRWIAVPPVPRAVGS